jgi:hypothetical protein
MSKRTRKDSSRTQNNSNNISKRNKKKNKKLKNRNNRNNHNNYNNERENDRYRNSYKKDKKNFNKKYNKDLDDESTRTNSKENHYKINKENSQTKQKEIIYKAPKYAKWMTERSFSSFGIDKLSKEIMDFFDFVTPTKEENIRRTNTIKEIKEIINKNWPNWKVKVFGSFPNNLHLRNSDVDIVVLDDNYFNDYDNKDISNNERSYKDKEQLRLIRNQLRKEKYSRDIQLIDAKVPILKMNCTNTDIKVDVS